MVKTVAAKINDELYDETLKRVKAFGLNNSQMVRYAFAIVCGYTPNSARILALLSPEKPLSELHESE